MKKQNLLKILVGTAALLCAVCAVLFFAVRPEKPVIEVNSAEVSEGVYRYYLDKLMSEKEDLASAKEEDLAKIKEEAISLSSKTELCRELIKKTGLSSVYKRQAAEQTEKLWSLYGAYYKKMGIEKQTLTEIMRFEESKKQLVSMHYGKGAKNEVSEMDLKEAFVDMYVGFKAVEGSLMKDNDMGERVEISPTEKKQLLAKFESYAKSINSGKMTVDDANEKYNSSLGIIVTSALEVTLVKDGDPLYADGFFSKVMDIDHGDCAVIESGSTVYLLQRQTIATTDEDAFALYSDEVLQHIKMGEIEKLINKKLKESEIKTDGKKTEKIFAEIYEKHTAGK